ncbi:cupin domain-containing protein, partial [Crossiella cryophila]|uniref:cupin domain-containing protein n=1 Tax=Crossiella cryophila TaxID=43355 RepID=UPI0031E97F10
MDVLSDVITALRTGTPRSAHVTWHGQWHQHYPEVPGAIGFHVILDGTCQLQSPTQLTLSTGDILFLPHSPAHTLAALTPEQSLPPAAYLAPPSTTAPQATFSNTAPGSQAPAPPETTDPSLANPITTLGRPMFTPPETTGASLFAPAPPQLASANSGRTTKSPPLPKPLPTHIRATTSGTGPITTIT